MLKRTIVLLSFFINNKAFSQEPPLQEHVGISLGKSYNGSGDLQGFFFNAEYGKTIKRNFSWVGGFNSTMHYGSVPLFFKIENGEIIDGSVRFVIAGLQMYGLGSYSLVNTKQHDLFLRIGPLVRYQYSSNTAIVDINYPPLTGLPVPVIVLENISPMRTLSIGYMGQAGYSYTTKKAIYFGISGAFQNDTNGDVITNISLSIGKRFR